MEELPVASSSRNMSLEFENEIENNTSNNASNMSTMLNRKWYSKNNHDYHKSESLKSLRNLLILILVFGLTYSVIIAAIGYKYKQGPNATSEDEQLIKKYFYVSSGLAIGVMIFGIIGVIRESPIVTIIVAMFCLLSVAQSTSTSSSSPTDSSATALMSVRLHSPVIIITILGCLLTIYTALIWSSEFETPPQIKEEYKWYLDRLTNQEKNKLKPVASTASTMSALTLLQVPEK